MADDNKKKLFLDAYDNYAGAIYRHCFFRIFSKERAEELVQETFMKTWQYLSDGKEIGNIRAFLYRVATNLIIDDSRKKKEVSLDRLTEDVKSFQPADDSHKVMERPLIMKEVAANMQKLVEEDRELIIMRYIDDFQPKEIAEILNTDANNVSVKLNRALEKLKKVITRVPIPK